MLTISLCDFDFISNPYVKAKFVELIYYLIMRNRSLMKDHFQFNEPAKV